METIPTTGTGLPTSVSREMFARLCGTLPPSPGGTAETQAACEFDAMAAVVALHPADAFEARLAVQIIAADGHVVECLRLAAKHANDFTVASQCRAQAALMMRQVQAALRTLQKMQSVRTKNSAAQQAAAAAIAAWAPLRDAEPPEPAPHPDIIAAADEYATRYPFRAARIRANGGLQRNVKAGLDPAITPPDPAIVQAIVTGTSPILRALDLAERKVATAA